MEKLGGIWWQGAESTSMGGLEDEEESLELLRRQRGKLETRRKGPFLPNPGPERKARDQKERSLPSKPVFQGG